jgi:hypothetical protein
MSGRTADIILKPSQPAVADCFGASTASGGVEWLLASALVDRLRTLDIQIDNHRILSASDDYRFTRHICAGVNFLMRDVGWNVNEIPRVCLIAEL